MANKPNIRFKGFTDDWEQRKLGEICERLTRKNKDNESDLPLTISSQHGLIDQRDFFNKVVAAKDMSEYYLLQKGEFAYNKSYSNGYDYGSIKRLNSYEKGCLSTLYICFKLISDKVNSDYLECYFDTLAWYYDVSQICSEGARNHGLLNVDVKAFFTEVTVKLPVDVKEQQQISAILHSLDHLIALHQRKCDETKKLKKFMLQKMFPKNGEKNPEIRFAGFTDDWEQRKLGEDLESIQTGTNLLGSENNNGMPLLKMGNIQRGYFDTSKLEYLVDNKSVEPENVAYYGDFFFNTRNTMELVGKGATWTGESGKYAFNSNIARFKLKGIDTIFFNFLYNTDSMAKQVHARAMGTTSVAAIYPRSLDSIDYCLPCIDEQKRIGDYFRNLDHLITLHQRE